MATTRINWNGSKWAGEDPDGLDEFERRLRENTLDPIFEKFGNFAENEGAGLVRFWGNFFDVSGAFSIESDDPAVVARLTAGIKANQATTAYKAARAERRAQDAERDARAWGRK